MLGVTVIVLIASFVSIIITGHISTYYIAASSVCLLGYDYDFDRQTKDAYFVRAFPISSADYIKTNYIFDAVTGVILIVICSIGYFLHHVQNATASTIYDGIYAVLALCPALLTIVAIKALSVFVFNIRGMGFLYLDLGIIFIIPIFKFASEIWLMVLLSVILLILNIIIGLLSLKRFRFERM